METAILTLSGPLIPLLLVRLPLLMFFLACFQGEIKLVSHNHRMPLSEILSVQSQDVKMRGVNCWCSEIASTGGALPDSC